MSIGRGIVSLLNSLCIVLALEVCTVVQPLTLSIEYEWQKIEALSGLKRLAELSIDHESTHSRSTCSYMHARVSLFT